MPKVTAYREVFFMHNGPGPWPCYFCAAPVRYVPRRVDIHHVDGDHANNDPQNLKASHRGCHRSYHARLRGVSDETRRKIREAKIGSRMSAEAKEKLRVINTGKKLSVETRQRMSEAQRRRYQK